LHTAFVLQEILDVEQVTEESQGLELNSENVDQVFDHCSNHSSVCWQCTGGHYQQVPQHWMKFNMLIDGHPMLMWQQHVAWNTCILLQPVRATELSSMPDAYAV
jgi:hypothetical protein